MFFLAIVIPNIPFSDFQDLQDPEELYQFVEPSPEIPGTFICSVCKEFKGSRRGLVRNHVESMHFKGVFRYHCDVCNKDFQGRNALAVHNSALHPSRPKVAHNFLKGADPLNQINF